MGKKHSLAYVPVVIGVALVLFSGCVTPQSKESTITRQSGSRVHNVTFDTSFSREQYVILDTVSGEGTVERKLIGKKRKEKSLLRWLLPKSYYIFEYDRSLGAWVDEGPLSIDAMSDRKMSVSETMTLLRMEKIAARIALYRALETVPEADAILAPHYEFTYKMDDRVLSGDLIIARYVDKVDAKITGKAVRIKTEDELYATYENFPGLVDKSLQYQHLELRPFYGE